MDGSIARTKNETEIASMLRQLVAAIVDDPSQIAVHCLRTGDELHLTVEVAAVDLDRLSGRDNRTSESLAVIVRAAGLKGGDRCYLHFEQTGALSKQLANASMYP